MKELVLPFGNFTQSYSQAGQDLFVLSALDGLCGGRFIDVGCSHPKTLSNTYLLESEFAWNGILIDMDSVVVDLCKKERTSKCVCADATILDYKELLKEEPGIIDYLSVDIDGIYSFRVLQKIPFTDYKFKVITFEHNAYTGHRETRELSRKHLDGLGYFRLCSDVTNDGFMFEDWYVHPELVDIDRVMVLLSGGIEWRNILFKD
jgi:hypothetical protein